MAGIRAPSTREAPQTTQLRIVHPALLLNESQGSEELLLGHPGSDAREGLAIGGNGHLDEAHLDERAEELA